MARTSRHVPAWYDFEDCFCPTCGRIWGSRSRPLPTWEGVTQQGRVVCPCPACLRRGEHPRPHKDLPGQQSFC